MLNLKPLGRNSATTAMWQQGMTNLWTSRTLTVQSRPATWTSISFTFFITNRKRTIWTNRIRIRFSS